MVFWEAIGLWQSRYRDEGWRSECLSENQQRTDSLLFQMYPAVTALMPAGFSVRSPTSLKSAWFSFQFQCDEHPATLHLYPVISFCPIRSFRLGCKHPVWMQFGNILLSHIVTQIRSWIPDSDYRKNRLQIDHSQQRQNLTVTRSLIQIEEPFCQPAASPDRHSACAPGGRWARTLARCRTRSVFTEINALWMFT